MAKISAVMAMLLLSGCTLFSMSTGSTGSASGSNSGEMSGGGGDARASVVTPEGYTLKVDAKGGEALSNQIQKLQEKVTADAELTNKQLSGMFTWLIVVSALAGVGLLLNGAGWLWDLIARFGLKI